MSLPGLDFNTWNAKNTIDANSKIKSVDENRNILDKNAEQIQSKWKYAINTNKSFVINWWHCFNNSNRAHNSNVIPKKAETNAEIIQLPKQNLEANLIDDNTINTQIVYTPLPRRVLSVRRQESREVQTRALVRKVAQYYENYVNEMNLQRFFRENTFVTSIKPYLSSRNRKARWLVKGAQANGIPFAYICRNVVLANGASDLANRLGVSGEDSHDWIKHDLPSMVSALEKIPDAERPGTNSTSIFI